jgi:hypothetical protein
VKVKIGLLEGEFVEMSICVSEGEIWTLRGKEFVEMSTVYLIM